MEDDRAVELYAAFRGNYRYKLVPTIVSSPDLDGGATMPASTLLMYNQIVSDNLRELSNSINDFCRWINMLSAWAPIYEASEQDEQLSLLVEHISPFSALRRPAPSQPR